MDIIEKELIVNDLSFQYVFDSEEQASKALRDFVHLCKSLEEKNVTNVKKIKTPPVNIYDVFVSPDIKLVQLIKRQKMDRDETRYLLGLLVNNEKPNVDNLPLCSIDGKCSQIGSYAVQENRFLVSLINTDIYKSSVVNGMIENESVRINNISKMEHISAYRYSLGVRIYRANAGKHKAKPNAYGKGKVASPMDLDDEEAQNLLNEALTENNRLYGKYKGNYYSFQCEQDVYYHAYIDDNIPENIRRKLDQKFS